MMNLGSVAIHDFSTRIFDLWDQKWFLLTAGDFERNEFNTMTVSWGSFGIMWNRPFAQVVVRPTRYTYEFTEKFDTFTLCAFDHAYRRALQLLGSKSGRHSNKIADAGLTPCASDLVAAPSFQEADLIFECTKLYWQDMDHTQFLDPKLEHNYPSQDYHRIYFGEILTIREKQ